MTDPILLLAAADACALLLVAAVGSRLTHRATGFATTGLSGLGALLCLPPLLSHTAVSGLELPIGPPGLRLHLALDPISALFLLVIFLCGTAVSAFWAVDGSRAGSFRTGAARAGLSAESRGIALCLGGLSMLSLAADAVTLAIGSALSLASIALPNRSSPPGAALPPNASPATSQVATAIQAFVPGFLLLIAVYLLTPLGSAPRFDVIRTASVDPVRAATAAALAIAASIVVLRPGRSHRRWPLDALAAGAVSPGVTYVLLRLVVDLPGAAAQAWWGFALLLVGGITSTSDGWQAARHPDLDGSVACLARRQSGLAFVGLGLTLIARAADLPDAASLALAATLLLTITSGVAGTLASLAAHVLGHEAGSWRMARLGGLVQSMPVVSISLATALLALAALPPGVGFAAIWLLFQSILSAPRTGGLISQVLLALIAAALALSTALGTAASVRLLGVAILSRPRSVRGSAARDAAASLRPILLTYAGLSVLLGLSPGLALKALAAPVIRVITGTGLGGHAGLATLSVYGGSPGYSALPIAALLALATGSIMFFTRRVRTGIRIAEVWNDGLAGAPDLPFGDPLSQSAGAGFLPPLPSLRSAAAGPVAPGLARSAGLSLRSRRLLAGFMAHTPSARVGTWAILLAFGALLLMLSLFGDGGING